MKPRLSLLSSEMDKPMDNEVISIVAQHPQSIIDIQNWVLAVFGGLISILVGFIWRQWWRIDKEFKAELMTTLRGIRNEQKEGNLKFDLMNRTMMRIEKELTEEISKVDKRVYVLENNCKIFHHKAD